MWGAWVRTLVAHTVARRNEYVDFQRCVSNDVCETVEVFGIEGGRTLVLKEMKNGECAGRVGSFWAVTCWCSA
jgi:hypothetical protein